MTPTRATYLRDYRRLHPRDPAKRKVESHLLYYRNRPHPMPCSVCSHPCPGLRCMTTLHDPYQLLCGYCARTP